MMKTASVSSDAGAAAARRTREALQQANARLQAANEELACVAARDLQEPLRTVRGVAELLPRRYAEDIDDRGRKWLELIVSGTGRMQALIEGLLACSRAGRTGTAALVDTQVLVTGVISQGACPPSPMLEPRLAAH